MFLVIPMAGESKRFLNKGYAVPKYMIEAKGLTLFDYALKSLPLDIMTKIIFVGLKSHEEKYRLSDFIEGRMKDIFDYPKDKYRIVLLDHPTQGQAETVYKAKDHVLPDKDLIIYNVDTYFRSGSLTRLLSSSGKKDGVLGAFVLKDKDPKWSFAKVDGDGVVVKTAEKEQISSYALTGMYHFSRAEDFFNVFEYHAEQKILFKNEYYVAPMYNYLIVQGKKFVLNLCDSFQPLGTPEDVESFIDHGKNES